MVVLAKHGVWLGAFLTEVDFRWISDRNRNANKQAYLGLYFDRKSTFRQTLDKTKSSNPN